MQLMQWMVFTSMMACSGAVALLSQKKDPFHRVWFLCKGAPFDQASKDEQSAGITSTNPMKCTKEMTMPELYCAPWKSGLAFDVTSLVNLPNAKEAGSTGGLYPSSKIIKLCTQAASGQDMMKTGHQTAATMPVECVDQDFQEEDLNGGDGIVPGEIFLRARILFFIKQGIPGDKIPTCAGEVQSCSNGLPPTTVAAEWIDATQKSDSASLLLLRRSRDTNMTSDSAGSFAGTLMTSGSFTMMAAGGANF